MGHWATREGPPPTELLERVFAVEAAKRQDGRFQGRLQKSGLKEQKTLEAFDWAFQPKLDKSRILEIAQLDFARRNEDLLLTGKSGTGKSHILQAIALRACQHMSVRYARCVDLVADLYAGLADGSYPRRVKAWVSPKLVVIDDVGLGQVKKRDDEPTAAHMLFDLLDRRHGKASTALSSNIELSEWGRYLGDATLATAIPDRVGMRAIGVDIDGPSYRQYVARQRSTPKKQKDQPGEGTS
ncbi:MAG: ATP-binding protein [Deltaproteobacteria bacterium]|nr:ATP-binding protein [Deltaproteobacteria bacterium]